MSVTVYIPTPFRRATNNRDRVQVQAPTIGGLLDELEGEYTSLKGLVRSEEGEVHQHVNIYVNNEEIDALSGLATPLKDGDEVTIIPALAGGSAGSVRYSDRGWAPAGLGHRRHFHRRHIPGRNCVAALERRVQREIPDRSHGWWRRLPRFR